MTPGAITRGQADMALLTAGLLDTTATMVRAGMAATTIASSVAGLSTATGLTGGFASAGDRQGA